MHKRSWIVPLSMMAILLTGCGDGSSKEEGKEVNSGAGIVVTEGAVGKLKKADDSKANSGQFYYSYNKEKKGDSYNSETSRSGQNLMPTVLSVLLMSVCRSP